MSEIDHVINAARSDRQPLEHTRVTPRTWSLSTVVALIFLVVLVLPSISYIGHGLVTAWVVYPIWLMIILLEHPGLIGRAVAVARRRRFELTMFAGWSVVVLVNALLGRAYAGEVHSRLLVTIAMIVFMDLVYAALGRAWRNTLMTALFVLLGLEVIRSIPTLWSDSGVVRQVMFQGGSSVIYESAFLSGVGEYGFYTGCAIISPVVLAAALNTTGRRRFAFLVIWVAVLLSLVLVTLMGAVLLAAGGFVAMSLLTIVSSRQRGRLIIVFVFIAVAGTIAWDNVFSETNQGQLISNKLELQSTSVLEYGLVEGDLTNRATLWQNSIDTFLANPVFGVGPSTGTDNPNMGYVVGGHSAWLDLPAEYGLVGAFFYFGFILSAIRRAWVNFRQRRGSQLAIAQLVSGLLFLVGGSYNPVVFFIEINLFLSLFALGGLQSESATDQSRMVKPPRRLSLPR